MKAEEYLEEHWIKNKVYDHLKWKKHQVRLETCANLCIGERFADVGCGLGHSTNIMKNFVGGSWTGIEFCGYAVKRARKLFPDIEFIYVWESYVDQLPFVDIKSKDLRFDSIVCSEVIEHVEKDREFVEALVRMTKKKVILTTPNKKVSDPGHLRVYTEKSLCELVEGLGRSVLWNGEQFFYMEIFK